MEYPISRGKKKAEAASMTIPRRAKTKPIFAVEDTIRIAHGRVRVIPIPTAEPLMAQMVGFGERWMEREARPPLRKVRL